MNTEGEIKNKKRIKKKVKKTDPIWAHWAIDSENPVAAVDWKAPEIKDRYSWGTLTKTNFYLDRPNAISIFGGALFKRL